MIHYGVERDESGKVRALTWSPAMQYRAEQEVKAYRERMRELQRRARAPMAAYQEWARARGVEW